MTPTSRRGRMRATAVLGAALALTASASATLAMGSSALASKTPPAPKPPVARTGGAQHIGENSATLSGSVDPHGSETNYYFQYGTTTSYGAQTPTTSAGAGTASVKVSQSISGLQLGTTYHYRLVVESPSSPSPVLGSDRTFMTKQASTKLPRQTPLKFALFAKTPTVTYGSSLKIAGTLTGFGGADQQVELQTSAFPYLHGFEPLGSATTTGTDGSFSLRVPRVKQNMRLRVCTVSAQTAYSQVVNVRVAVRVTLKVQPVGNGELVRFSGTVSPAQSGAPVVFQLQRTGRSPKSTGDTQVSRGHGSSRFSALVSIRKSGSYRALVKVTGGRQVSGSSRWISVRSVVPAHKRRLGRHRI